MAARRLNAFERVVARLCQAGVTDSKKLAELTQLHPDLCNQVLLMLHQRRLVDRQGRLTEQGTAALKGEAWDISMSKVVHVFQDPFGDAAGQGLWPAVREELAYANVDYGSGGKPQLRAKLRRDSPSVLPLVPYVRDLSRPRRPSPEAILAASRQSLRAQTEHEGTVRDRVPSAHVGRVSFIEDRPEAVLLIAGLRLPEDALSGGDWEVLDPFTHRPSAWLKDRMRTRAADDAGLAALIAELEGELDPADAALRQEEYRRERAQAAHRVESRSGPWISDPQHAKVFGLLTEIEAGLAEAEALGGFGGRRRQAAVNDAGKLLEHVFAQVYETYPLNKAYRSMLGGELGPEILAERLGDAVRILAAESPLPMGLTRQSSDQVARAAAGYLPSLRAGLVTALLAAAEHPGHPLRSALEQVPYLCDLLDGVAQLRNDGAHQKDLEPTQPRATDVLELVYWTVSALLSPSTTRKRTLDAPIPQQLADTGA
ncbi:hypothetical protein [Nonomuraea sp. NPDC048901]|uniref:hypothetical protein n=1 Tax=Nonomuraea sp. NPDC048901 TaxID=3155627 RepID=UPI0033F9737E